MPSTVPSHVDVLLDRLTATGQDSEPWALHVLAAAESEEALARLLDDGLEPARRPASRSKARRGTRDVPRIYLEAITVAGFRGIGPESQLKLRPGPGLTLVVGRNGSGKSSFAEALEVLFTGDSFRWMNKGSVVWKAGWRNLHHGNAPLIQAKLTVEGLGEVLVRREWAEGAALEDGETTVVTKENRRGTLADLGWDVAVGDYRPFLSYSELGSLIEEGPLKFSQALLKGLGLEQLEEVRKRLASAASQREKSRREAKKARKELADLCEERRREQPDDRIDQAIECLRADPLPLDRLRDLVAGGGTDDGSDLALLDRLAAMTPPSAESVAAAAAALREAEASVRQRAMAQAGRARAVASLLQQALDVGSEDGTCPVCETPGVITDAWRKRAQQQIERLRQDAADFDAAQQQLHAAIDAARQLCIPVPQALQMPRIEEWPAGVDAREAWARWAEGSALREAEPLAGHLEREAPLLSAAVEAMARWAREERDRRQDAWRPVAEKLGAWLPAAAAAERCAEQMPLLKEAEGWMRETVTALRSERFNPIAERSKALWAQMRLQSNVDLIAVELAGTGVKQSVDLQVEVDGTAATALGVMSQGELNSLVLSLFLPRVMLPENPFGFVIVDDPVQAMDPARVEGLARILEETARQRQVVVFTHDDRLPEAVRRLQIKAEIVNVTRRAKSVLELKTAQEPVDAYLRDARALMKAIDSDKVPLRLAELVVPGFCRLALEAACIEVVRRRRLGRGDAHADVERALEEARTLNQKMALALEDDVAKAGEVATKIRNKWGPRSLELFKACNEGAHGQFAGNLDRLVDEIGRMTGYVRKLA
ncbi:MAG TPA: AAA family ATPase [Vicinamibacterales bacterium]